MRLPRPASVPMSARLSGVVFVLVLFNIGGVDMLRNLGIILGSWGIVCLGEQAWNWNDRRRRAAAPSAQ